MTPPQGMPLNQERRTDKGAFCLFGCLSLAVIGLLLIAGVLLLLYKITQSTLEEFTATEPIELPEVVYTDAEYQALDARLAPVFAAVQDPAKSASITLTDKEINMLLLERDELQPMGQWVRVRIEENTMQGDLSIPLNALGLPIDMLGLGGSFFNGSGKFDIGMTRGNNKRPYLTIQELQMGETTMSEMTIEQMNLGNLLEPQSEMHPDQREFLERLSRVELKGNALTVHIDPEQKEDDQ